MKVLVLGAYGMLGHKLYQKLGQRFEAYGTCRHVRREWSGFVSTERLASDVDAYDLSTVEKAIQRTRPDGVLNCIGIIKQLEEAKQPVPSVYINSLFPHKLAELCRHEGARLVHFSTDCVFSGKKGMYRLDDLPDAEDLYGRTKLLGEVSGDGCITLRSSIIGRELGTRNGLVEWFISQKGKQVKGFKNAIYTGFTTIEMSNIVGKVLTDHADLSGVWQVASHSISKFDLLKLIKEKLALDIQLEPDEEYRCDRSLDGSVFAKRTGYRAPSWDSMIEELAEESPMYDRPGKGGRT